MKTILALVTAVALVTGCAAPSTTITAPDQNHVSVGYIGDSITVGTYGGDTTGSPPIDEAATLAEQGENVTVTNCGIAGTTTANWLPGSSTGDFAAAAAKFTTAHVSVVSIMLGTNDSKIPVALAPTQYTANIKAISAALVADGYRVIVNAPPYAVPGSADGQLTAGSDTLLRAYAPAIAGIVNGATIVAGDTSAYAYFAAHTNELPDGVHPNAAGNEALGALWATAARPLF